MNATRAYVVAFQTLDPERVLAYMRLRGHLSLLPRVVRMLEAAKSGGPTLTVARQEDGATAPAAYARARMIIDPRIVGGYLYQDGSRVHDGTFRTALVTLYKKIIAHA